ncbi:MAG: STAS domain-containing protein [Magnetospirillum sp. WYHS-4]
MKYEIRRQDDGTSIVALSGDVDLESSGEMRQVLLENLAHARHLRVDMAQVTVIDSSGVAGLIEAYQTARKKGKSFSLARVPNVVARVLKLAKLDTVFPVDPD